MAGDARETGVAVVTGASGAIGGALAAALAEEGYGLVVVARTEQSVQRVLELHGARCMVADLESIDDVERLCGELGTMERLPLLVHAAGRFTAGAISDTSPDELDALYRVNVRAPVRLTQALLPALRAAAGQIVFVNSSAGARRAEGAGAAYAATKHALRAAADAFRAEENVNGVRVLTVFPGRTAGPLQTRLHELEAVPYEPGRLLQPHDVAVAVLGALRLPSTGEVTEIHVRPMQKPRS